ncbi:MAG: nucleoside transporter C-terminal domain-containing protein [Nocardioidaceae bacterium]
MSDYRGVLGLVFLLAVAWVFSKNRTGIQLRTVIGALVLQIGFAALVLRWQPGRDALAWVSEKVANLIGYTEEGTAFIFGPLLGIGEKGETIFALQVLPVIIFLGALIGLLFYLRVIQFATFFIGGAISWLLRVSKIESMFASTVIFLGQSEAPLMIAPYLRGLSTGQLFTVMSSGFAAVAGSTLVGYSLLGAPLEYLLAATVMNAPAGLLMAKIMWPDSTPEPEDSTVQPAAAEREERRPVGTTSPGDIDVRAVRDEESANAIDAVGRGAIAGGKIAVTVGGLLIAFVALIAMANGILGGIGGWFGQGDLTFEKLLGWVVSPLAWLLGVPWSEATEAGSFIGQKTVINEFVAYASFGPNIGDLSPVTVIIVTFALAGFANFTSIAIQIGTISSLVPELRGKVAQLGLRALLAGSLANLANAAIAGMVAAT